MARPKANVIKKAKIAFAISKSEHSFHNGKTSFSDRKKQERDWLIHCMKSWEKVVDKAMAEHRRRFPEEFK